MKQLLVCLFTGTILGGCAAPALTYVHSTTVGIDVSGSAAAKAKVSLGYDRESFALVPLKKDETELQTIVARSCLGFRSMWDFQVRHAVWTGGAAEDAASRMAEGKTAGESLKTEMSTGSNGALSCGGQ